MTLTARMRSKSSSAELLERLRQVADAGVVDEDVEAAEVRSRGLDHRLDVGGVRDVGATPRASRRAPRRRAPRRRRRGRRRAPARLRRRTCCAMPSPKPEPAPVTIAILSCESHAVSPRCLRSAVVDGDRLQRREAVQRLEALLAAVARMLDAAERQLDAAAGAVVVDEHLAAAAAPAPCAAARPPSRVQTPATRPYVRAVGDARSPRPRRRTAISTCTGPKISSCASACVGAARRRAASGARSGRRSARRRRSWPAAATARPLSRASAR